MKAQLTTEQAVSLISCWGFHFTSALGSSWAQHHSSHHLNLANKVDTRNIMRQVNLHRAAHCEQTAHAVLKQSRQNIVGQVGIPPTSASWTNSPPPHLSILWDDHITGMITSTSWDDHISCARQHIVENYLFYDIPSTRRWPRSADPTAAWSSWALSRPPQGRGGRACAWIICCAFK